MLAFGTKLRIFVKVGTERISRGQGLVERFMDDLDNLFLLNYQPVRELKSIKKAILTDLGCLFTNTATKLACHHPSWVPDE